MQRERIVGAVNSNMLALVSPLEGGYDDAVPDPDFYPCNYPRWLSYRDSLA